MSANAATTLYDTGHSLSLSLIEFCLIVLARYFVAGDLTC